ncbi:MAG TPA: hypothetical protein PK079_23070 [Leptospiraceae bacterium]|nr:hypothetical protein [Leptospiraceae bacterium]HNB98372.1 hypothetical protein [Leptospiraceae bacterium]HNE09563.1 hypothetical protein [Leptospiraceae bacterium]HNE56066.1 hypothetical protein [Leptospiraceae bacterium]
MKQSKIRFFIFTIFSICFAVGFLWVIIDSIMVWRGFKPLDLSYGFETEFLEGRGYAMRRGTQNYRTFINSLGMRREELPELVPGEKRILTLGDSTCYSSNASFENSWPNVLERDLRSKGNKITVMNGGVPGYSTMNMYHAFKWYLKRTKIDYVIIHGGWNNYWNDKALVENFDPDSYLKKIFPNSPDLEDVNKNLTVIENIDSSSNLLEHSSGAMKYIATSSALGHYLVKNIWLTIIDPMLRGSISQGSKVNSVDNKKSITSVNPELAIDDYMLYLGLLIKEARKNNITPIIIKPFSVLRIPGFNALKASKEYPLYMAKDYTWMIPRMKEMDKASEVFSKYNLA